MMKNNRFRVSKWIMLSISLMLNSFIIVYSCLSEETTIKWNNFVTNLFANIVNNMTQKDVEIVPMTEFKISLSDETSHMYNYLPGYELNEIPLGSAKQIEYTFAPENATDKSIEYSTEQKDIVSLNQSGGVLSVVGMKTGTATIVGKNKSSSLESSCEVKVIEAVEPQQFEVSVDSNTVEIGKQLTINFDINGGNLGHNELINFRYYDTRKLNYSSSNDTILSVDSYGVVHPLSEGTATVTISNSKGFSRTIDITVSSGTPSTPYSDLKVGGPSICYGNDMINDQSSNKNHYQLEVYDGETKLNLEDFNWESSNELLVKVDKHGVMRGFRKSIQQDESATITAISKLTGQTATYKVVVKEQLPTKIDWSITKDDKLLWNPTEYTTCVGDSLLFQVYYKPNVWLKDVNVFYDEEYVDFINQGATFTLNIKKEGTSSIKVTSIVNPELSFEVKLVILKAGAIATNDIEDVGRNIRKIIGHASLFAIAEVFTLLALYMLFFEKKEWLALVISLGIELSLSGLSELIQHFIEGRTGSFKDVLINFSGAVIAAGIVVGIYFLIKGIKKHKNKKQVE